METQVDATFQPLGAFNILLVNMPADLVNQFNTYVDENQLYLESLSSRLVGQIRQNEKSQQLDIPLEDGFGSIMKNFIDGMGTSYVRHGYDGGAVAETYELWSNDSYEGDYQPLHMHGSRTPAVFLALLTSKFHLKLQKDRLVTV